MAIYFIYEVNHTIWSTVLSLPKVWLSPTVDFISTKKIYKNYRSDEIPSQIFKYLSIWVFKYSSIQVFNYLSI